MFVQDTYGDRFYLYDDYWEDTIDYLEYKMEEAGFVNPMQDVYCISVDKCNWQGRSGYKFFYWKDNKIDNFVRESFGSMGDEFTVSIWEITKDYIKASISTHDVYSSSLEIRPAKKCDWCSEPFLSENEEQNYCNDTCKECDDDMYQARQRILGN